MPARMVNEYVYCPRLFYLEWVDGRFADSDDTVEGRHVHRAVDTETGAAPLPEDGELRAARSVMLSSPRIGVVAKLDLIEGDGGAVIPVDFKKGRPQPDGTPWPSDSVQVRLQGLLLRENGYRSDHGEVYYAQVRQRVRVEFDEPQLADALALVADARAASTRTSPPLPLVDSPKCPRCSLVGLCLPDETNLLLAVIPTSTCPAVCPRARDLIGPTAASNAPITSSRSTSSVTAAIPATGVSEASGAPITTRCFRSRPCLRNLFT